MNSNLIPIAMKILAVILIFRGFFPRFRILKSDRLKMSGVVFPSWLNQSRFEEIVSEAYNNLNVDRMYLKYIYETSVHGTIESRTHKSEREFYISFSKIFGNKISMKGWKTCDDVDYFKVSALQNEIRSLLAEEKKQSYPGSGILYSFKCFFLGIFSGIWNIFITLLMFALRLSIRIALIWAGVYLFRLSKNPSTVLHFLNI